MHDARRLMALCLVLLFEDTGPVTKRCQAGEICYPTYKLVSHCLLALAIIRPMTF